MEEILKELTKRLDEMPGNPVAKARAEKLRSFLAESEAQMERDLRELREDQARQKASMMQSEMKVLSQIKVMTQFEEDFLSSIKEGNTILARFAGDHAP